MNKNQNYRNEYDCIVIKNKKCYHLVLFLLFLYRLVQNIILLIIGISFFNLKLVQCGAAAERAIAYRGHATHYGHGSKALYTVE